MNCFKHPDSILAPGNFCYECSNEERRADLGRLPRYNYSCPTHGAYETIFRGKECEACESLRIRIEDMQFEVSTLKEIECYITDFAKSAKNEVVKSTMLTALKFVRAVRSGYEATITAAEVRREAVNA
jgi:hypothetical protein